jgi:hypothetical protein
MNAEAAPAMEQTDLEATPQEARPSDDRPQRKSFDRTKRFGGHGRSEGKGRHDRRPGRYRPTSQGSFERTEDEDRINALIHDAEQKLAEAIHPLQLPNLNSFERKQVHQHFERRQPDFETKTYRGDGEVHVLWVFPISNLKKFVQEKANEALATDSEVTLPPMSSYERFVVHNVMKEMEGVEAVSIGEGAERHIEIHPKKFGRGLKKIMKKIKLM